MSRQAMLVAFAAALALTTLLLAAAMFGRARDGSVATVLSSLQSIDLRIDSLEARLGDRLSELEEDLLNATLPPSMEFVPPREAFASEGGGDDGGEPATRGEAAPTDPLERTLARLDDLEMRVRGLEQDPVERGYSYLESQNFELRRQGILALERVAQYDPNAREAIRRMLQDPDPRVRVTAIDTVADIGDKESSAWVASLLSDPDASVRRESVNALVRFGTKESGAEIAQLLRDPDASVRERAADALGRLKYEGGSDLLLEALADPNDGIRGEAIASLGEIGARNALPALRKMYDSDPGRHRFRLATSLKALGDAVPYQQEVTRISKTALTDSNDRARREALRTLTWFARDQAREVLQQAASDPNERVRRDAERMLREVGGDERR